MEQQETEWTSARVTKQAAENAEALRRRAGFRSVSATFDAAVRFLQDSSQAEAFNAFLAFAGENDLASPPRKARAGGAK
jgi:hypothetical protein